MDASTPFLSFIGIVDFSKDARFLHATESATDVLGYEPKELRGKAGLDLVHPDEIEKVRQLHKDTIESDKAAVICYIRMRHKNPNKGYILCCVTRTVCHNVVVGSISYATSSKPNMMVASTAKEVTVITPEAKDLQFFSWNDTDPMHFHDVEVPNTEEPVDYPLLPAKSFRTALILERFELDCTIRYCTNDILLSTVNVLGRPFFDFVAPKDEEKVRSWIDTVKSWGVNETGQPSEGGFAYGGFALWIDGRDSRQRGATSSRGRGGKTRATRKKANSDASNPMGGKRSKKANKSEQSEPQSEQKEVDAIFSAHSDGLMIILRPVKRRPQIPPNTSSA